MSRLRAAKRPDITSPVLSGTVEADDLVSALEVFPPDNPWNVVVEAWPVASDSVRIVASMGADRKLRYNPDMNFVLVPENQEKVHVKVQLAAESDMGPFPVPGNTPIEGACGLPGHPSLDQAQRDARKKGGDRHAIVIDPVNRVLYEFFMMRKTDAGWEAGQASRFDLKTNAMRPERWTSTDAAGLPIFPGVVRYDELRRGVVEHAMRVTARKTRREFVYPARHYASRSDDASLPRMGERLRLRQSVDISGFGLEARAILKGLKKYGMFVADNGIDWAISGVCDPRVKSIHEELGEIKGSDFEVIAPPEAYRPE